MCVNRRYSLLPHFYISFHSPSLIYILRSLIQWKSLIKLYRSCILEATSSFYTKLNDKCAFRVSVSDFKGLKFDIHFLFYVCLIISYVDCFIVDVLRSLINYANSSISTPLMKTSVNCRFLWITLKRLKAEME